MMTIVAELERTSKDVLGQILNEADLAGTYTDHEVLVYICAHNLY